jgi:hypothetical protein
MLARSALRTARTAGAAARNAASKTASVRPPEALHDPTSSREPCRLDPRPCDIGHGTYDAH